MNYVFVFLGEFGYELLNWQGAIRKFSKTIDRTKDKIIICSRKGLEPFYECADKYIDISELKYFKNSVADMYWTHNPEINYYKKYEQVINKEIPDELFSQKDLDYQKKINKEIKYYAFLRFKNGIFEKLFHSKKYKFIYSSEHMEINGIEFGYPKADNPGIYADLNLDNNEFVKISAEKKFYDQVQKKLEFDLKEDYILCQTGIRDVVKRTGNDIEYKIISELAEKTKIVLLNFNTGRSHDSKSEFPEIKNCFTYNCNSFDEQSILIENSKACMFFTTGDFRSHNYVPPFMGKNVYAVAPSDIFKLRTSPIDFWNKNVFQFGGQIIPIKSEEIEKYNFYNLLKLF